MLRKLIVRGVALAVFTLLILLTASPAPAAAQGPTDPALLPLERILNPDGTLNLREGLDGSFDVHGWALGRAPDGSPRFSRAPDAPAAPGDEKWIGQFGPVGVDNQVMALAIRGKELYVGGGFVTAGGIPANHIAVWNTQTFTWSALGQGVSNWVYALAFKGSDLYVGGAFDQANGQPSSHIAKWSTTRRVWTPIAAGPDNFVRALSVKGKDVYVGGQFTSAAGVPDTACLARYHITDSSWHSLGAFNVGCTVLALAFVGTDLYAGGAFSTIGGSSHSNIARLSTKTGLWSDLDGGVTDRVRALAVKGKDLYVGGHFQTAGGITANHIAKWNAATGWEALGSGAANGTDDWVMALAVRGNGIFAAGRFANAGNHTALIGRWDTVAHTWSSIGSGEPGILNALAFAGDDLYFGSDKATLFAYAHNYIGRAIDEGHWIGPLGGGPDGTVWALAIKGTDLYVGGNFVTAAGQEAKHLARWDSRLGVWDALWSSGDEGTNGSVRALLFRGNDLYVGGEFSSAGGVLNTNLIARWSTIMHEWYSVDGGMTGIAVYALAGSGNKIYAGGSIDSAGGVVVEDLAEYDTTTGEWASTGGGATGGSIWVLQVKGTSVYAGGMFASVGGVAGTANLARWSASDRLWHSVGHLNDGVFGLALKGNDLYASGVFTSAGGVAAKHIARLNTTSGVWSALGSGLEGNAFGMAFRGNDLYVAGVFLSAGGTAANGVARWNVTARRWYTLGSGVDDWNAAVAIKGSDVYFGGGFTQAGGKPAHSLARWKAP